MDHPAPNYKTLYPWASSELLGETLDFTSHASIVTNSQCKALVGWETTPACWRSSRTSVCRASLVHQYTVYLSSCGHYWDHHWIIIVGTTSRRSSLVKTRSTSRAWSAYCAFTVINARAYFFRWEAVHPPPKKPPEMVWISPWTGISFPVTPPSSPLGNHSSPARLTGVPTQNSFVLDDQTLGGTHTRHSC